MKNFIKKHCWNCEYFNLYNNNKCELTNLTKSKNNHRLLSTKKTNETNN